MYAVGTDNEAADVDEILDRAMVVVVELEPDADEAARSTGEHSAQVRKVTASRRVGPRDGSILRFYCVGTRCR